MAQRKPKRKRNKKKTAGKRQRVGGRPSKKPQPKAEGRAEFVKRFEETSMKCFGIIAEICRRMSISRQTFYTWMNEDAELRGVFIDTAEAADDFAEAQLYKNVAAGNQRAIEFYLTNRRRSQWRRQGIFQEPDSGEEISVEEIYRRAVEIDITPPRIPGEDARIQRPDGDTRDLDQGMLESPPGT